jgi:PAS domain S-box-containing protein
MKITDFFNEAGKQKFKQNFPQFLADGHIENLEFELIGKNGAARLVSVNATAIKDNQGKLVKTRTVVHDITELKKSQLVIQLENQKNSMLLSSASDGIHILDVQGNIVEFSDSFANMLGYSREETANLNVRDWDAHIDQVQLVSLVNDLMASYETFETKHRRKNGTLLDVEIHAKGITLAGKQYLYASSRDITERKQAEARLRDSEERLALASLHNGVGIWDCNLTTGELVWDESMFALYHIDRSDFSGAVSAWEKSLHPDDRERCDQEIQETLCHNKPFDTVFRVVWPNSEVHYIKAVAKLFHDETGKPVRMLGTNIDITERIQKEKIRIQQLEQQRDILVQEVHHRIKNHLQGLLGLLNLYPHKNTTEKAFFQDIVAKINSIAVVYGIQGQGYTSTPCLCEIVTEICKSVEAFSSTRLDFNCHKDCQVLLIKDYAVPIALIINELIINAVKHSKAEMLHSIAIMLTVNENSAILNVENSCKNQSMFPDFDQGVGLGLGLSLIRAMLPHQGVCLSLIRQDGLVSAKLELEKPVILFEI